MQPFRSPNQSVLYLLLLVPFLFSGTPQRGSQYSGQFPCKLISASIPPPVDNRPARGDKAES